MGRAMARREIFWMNLQMQVGQKRAGHIGALAVLLLAGLHQAAWGRSPLQQLEAEILSSPSATEALTARCARLHLADPPVIHALRDPGLDRKAGPEIRRLLKVGAAEPVRYRRVRLVCGGQTLSDADNWYVPARLTAEMNASLDHTDTPFGTVVKLLDFQRRTVKTEALRDRYHVLRVTAVLVDAAGPFSLVQENYTRVLIRDAKP
jgi:chorismate-pyruvate lyase